MVLATIRFFILVFRFGLVDYSPCGHFNLNRKINPSSNFSIILINFEFFGVFDR